MIEKGPVTTKLTIFNVESMDPLFWQLMTAKNYENFWNVRYSSAFNPYSSLLHQVPRFLHVQDRTGQDRGLPDTIGLVWWDFWWFIRHVCVTKVFGRKGVFNIRASCWITKIHYLKLTLEIQFVAFNFSPSCPSSPIGASLDRSLCTSREALFP